MKKTNNVLILQIMADKYALVKERVLKTKEDLWSIFDNYVYEFDNEFLRVYVDDTFIPAILIDVLSQIEDLYFCGCAIKNNRLYVLFEMKFE